MLQFPPGCLWGAATSSYQVDGAWNVDGRGDSIWDRFTRRPGNILDGSNGDDACRHSELMPQDIALMKSLGLKSYRCSGAWPRVMPNGRGVVNAAGLSFYDRLVDQLLAAGIVPMATLYHRDLPQALQETGGWVNRDSADWFPDYARAVCKWLGDRVRRWATLNEPWVAAFLGHSAGERAPGCATHRRLIKRSTICCWPVVAQIDSSGKNGRPVRSASS
jgi:beta-glucosidase